MFAMSAVELAHAIQSKLLSVEELTRAYIERIEKFDGADGLNFPRTNMCMDYQENKD